MLSPNWHAPKNIGAVMTSRLRTHPCAAQFSKGDYAGLNLADHVGDSAAQVAANRAWLAAELNLPSAPLWLQQMHQSDAINYQFAYDGICADAAVAKGTGVLAIMSADCLPVLFCDVKGRAIGAAHAGWRGLLAGVLENTVALMGTRHHEVLAWLGVAIGAHHFEVGEEVRSQFVAIQPAAARCFVPISQNQYRADLYQLARLRLETIGITQIYGGEYCSYQNRNFYSHRRASHQGKAATGRMAALIWYK